MPCAVVSIIAFFVTKDFVLAWFIFNHPIITCDLNEDNADVVLLLQIQPCFVQLFSLTISVISLPYQYLTSSHDIALNLFVS